MSHTPPFDPSRRDFFRTVVLTAAAIVIAPSVASADAAASPDVYVDLGPQSKYADSGWTRVVLPSVPDPAAPAGSPAPAGEVIFVRQTKPNIHEALSARCTHRGCVVGFQADAKDFLCPCHGGTFDINGSNVSGPPKTPLHALATKVDSNGHLLVVQPPKFVPHHRDQPAPAG